MAYDFTVKGNTDLDTAEAQTGLSKLKSVGTLAFAAIGTGLTLAATTGLRYYAQMQQYQTSFEVMLGSAEKATSLMAELKTVAAETPFEIEDLAQTTQLLLNYGFTQEEVIDKMKMLGDISQGSSEKMNRIATAYGQMSSAGKVQLEDVKQMIEAGFNPLQEISQSTGETMASLYDRISKGTITVDEITASMERSTSAGGKYFGSMEKQSQTLTGVLSSLKDAVMNKLNDGLEATGGTLTTKVIPQLTRFVEKLDFTKLGDAIGKTLTFIVDSAKFLYTAFQILRPVILGVTVAFAGFKIITSVIKLFDALKLAIATNPYLLLGAALVGLVAYVADSITATDDYNKSTQDLITTLEEESAKLQNVSSELDTNAKAREDSVKNAEIEATKMGTLADQIFRLGEETNLTNGQQQFLGELIAQLNEDVPNLNLAYDNQTGALSRTKDEVYKLIEARKQEALTSAYMENYETAIKDTLDAEYELYKAEDQRKTLSEGVTKAKEEERDAYKELNEYSETHGGIMADLTSDEYQRWSTAKEALDEAKSSLGTFDESIAITSASLQKAKEDEIFYATLLESDWDTAVAAVQTFRDSLSTLAVDLTPNGISMAQNLMLAFDTEFQKSMDTWKNKMFGAGINVTYTDTTPLSKNYGKTVTTQVINFNTPVTSPSETARQLRMAATYGKAGS